MVESLCGPGATHKRAATDPVNRNLTPARGDREGAALGGVIRAYNLLINLLRFLAGVVVFGIFVLICVDVLLRILGGYVGMQPWTYSVPVVEYGLLGFAMLAAPYLVRIKGQELIEAVTSIVPPRVQWVMAKLSYLGCIVASCIFAWYSWGVLLEAMLRGTLDIRAEEIPLWYLILPMPLCFALVAVEFGRYLIGIDSMYGDRTEVRENV